MHNSNNILLINEQFTAVYPSLVKTLNSLTLAVVLQKIHFKAQLTDDGWVHCSMQELADDTGLSRDGVQRAMIKLRQMNLLFEDSESGYNNSKLWKIDHDVLAEMASTALSQDMRNRTISTAKSQSKQRDIADSTFTKELVKNNKNTDAFDDEVIRLANLLAELIVGNGSKQPFVSDKWYADIDKLHRLDGRSYEQIESAIRWCQDDSFWRGNILSPAKLRKQYDSMRLQAQRNQKQSKVTQALNWMQNIKWDDDTKELGK